MLVFIYVFVFKLFINISNWLKKSYPSRTSFVEGFNKLSTLLKICQIVKQAFGFSIGHNPVQYFSWIEGLTLTVTVPHFLTAICTLAVKEMGSPNFETIYAVAKVP